MCTVVGTEIVFYLANPKLILLPRDSKSRLLAAALSCPKFVPIPLTFSQPFTARRYRELTRDLPAKLFSFLVGFYCATAFATVIGQTGDWDVLSAALTVAVVEGIGALMYKASLPLAGNVKKVIIISNYWKAGLSLGLFLDSFKY
ncbi:hypothetical protein SASPL_138815 [Salvia splendens]|uniref:Ycf20-like protein n=1 Tax=Salvia splendens TaxID=180675 RepID=A0A8X8WW60_SALSN|nr:hypothetical protein SASPL_138815 [Salvia splendens]